MAEAFLKQAREAHAAHDEKTFIAASRMVAIAIGLNEQPRA